MKKMMTILAVAALSGCVAATPAVADKSDTYVDPGHTVIRTGIPFTDVYKVVDMESRTICYVTRYNGRIAMDCLPYYHEGSTPSGMQVDGE